MKIKEFKSNGGKMSKHDKKAVKEFRKNRKNKSQKWVAL